jgi:hypothetical protein
MARPQKPILLTAELEDGTGMDIIHVDNYYVLTYRQRPFTLRRRNNFLAVPHKYLKTSYPTQAVAENAVNRLNAIFNTNDFSYTAIGFSQD